MPILISDDTPVTIIHDTVFEDKPLTIYFDLTGKIVEIIYNQRVGTSDRIKQVSEEILRDCVFPGISKVKMPQSTSVSKPVHTSTIDSSSHVTMNSDHGEDEYKITTEKPLNPAEKLRREVEAERLSMSQPAIEKALITKAVCNRCPVACNVEISHTPTGKFLSVTGNACERGVGFAQNFLLEKFNDKDDFVNL